MDQRPTQQFRLPEALAQPPFGFAWAGDGGSVRAYWSRALHWP